MLLGRGRLSGLRAPIREWYVWDIRRIFLVSSSYAVVLVTLTLGLWPFHAPRNNVTWLPKGRGLHLGRFATIVSAAPFPDSLAASVEIWLSPATIWQSHTMLAFYRPGHPYLFSLHQRQQDLTIETEQSHHGRGRDTVVEGVFRRPGRVFLTVTLGPQGVAVFVNGVAARLPPRISVLRSDIGSGLVFGDSPGQGDNWEGDIFGLAVYPRQLTPTQVWHDYAVRTTVTPDVPMIQSRSGFYLFDEHDGALVRDRSGPGPDLRIPERYQVKEKLFLEAPWSEFRMSPDYWTAVRKNIAGFVPLGFCFYACFGTVLCVRRPALLTIVLAFLVSLAIEILQGFLPTRDSGTTDIITNTAGSWAGVVLYSGVVRSFVFLRLSSRWRTANKSEAPTFLL
jgi:VanZ family protein